MRVPAGRQDHGVGVHAVARAVGEAESIGTEHRSVVDQEPGDVHAGEDGDAELGARACSARCTPGLVRSPRPASWKPRSAWRATIWAVRGSANRQALPQRFGGVPLPPVVAWPMAMRGAHGTRDGRVRRRPCALDTAMTATPASCDLDGRAET